MEGKPKVSISNFSLMGENGIYSCENASIKYYAGKKAITGGLYSFNVLSEDTGGFSDIRTPSAMTGFKYNQETLLAFIDESKQMFLADGFYPGNSIGKIHEFLGTTASQNPSIITSQRGHILFTSSFGVGVGYFLKVDDSSSTYVTASTTVGISGGAGESFNFTNKGIDPANYRRNKIYNITKKKEYTITSITDSGLKANFASQTPAPQVNDYLLVFNDNPSYINFDVYTQFIGQQSVEAWSRQPVFWNDAYYFLNGNSLSKLNSNDTLWVENGSAFEAHHKKAPIQTQMESFAVNQEKMLIGCSTLSGGRLLLWDGYASGWINIIETDNTIKAITNYKSGFVFFSGQGIYYTDGYQIQKLLILPDTEPNDILGIKFNQICTVEDKILFSFSGVENARNHSGLYLLNPEDGTYTRDITKTTYSSYSCLYKFLDRNFFSVYAGFYDLVGNDKKWQIREIQFSRALRYNFTLRIPLGQYTNISKVELSLESNIDSGGNENSTYKGSVTVSYGEGKRKFFKQAQTDTAGTTTTVENIDGAIRPAIVGQAIIPINGNSKGELSFIQSIANPGTSSEVLTISPPLSTLPSSYYYFGIYDMYKAGTREIPNQNDNILSFTIPAFYSDTLYLNVFFSSSNMVAPSVTNINIY